MAHPLLCNYLLSSRPAAVSAVAAVAVSTAGAFVAGGAALFFSGTCAVMGTTILSCECRGQCRAQKSVHQRAVQQPLNCC
jgi:hypothetical protein